MASTYNTETTYLVMESCDFNCMGNLTLLALQESVNVPRILEVREVYCYVNNCVCFQTNHIILFRKRF
jgi:hypothetical protein